MRTFSLFSLGCKVNQYESQQLWEKFKAAGLMPSCGAADIIVINTCTVTREAERKSRQMIQRAIRRNPGCTVVVTGCYATASLPEMRSIKGISMVVDNSQKDDIPQILGISPTQDMVGINGFAGHTRAFVKVQDGCDNRCLYCKIPQVRGPSRSRALHAVLEEVERLIERGYKELVLCGICLGAYGRDLRPASSLSVLLERIEALEGDFRIRLSSLEAQDISEEFIERFVRSAKFCKHLHIPFQSGSNQVLRWMRRVSSRDSYIGLVRSLRSRLPDIAITTDILAGFPGESEGHFAQTLSFLEEIQPSRIHAFGFSPRPGTVAASLKAQVSPQVIKQRVKRICALGKRLSVSYSKRFLGKRLRVLPESDGIGYSENYIRVRVKGCAPEEARGGLVWVDILKYCPEGYLEGTFVKGLLSVSAPTDTLCHI